MYFSQKKTSSNQANHKKDAVSMQQIWRSVEDPRKTSHTRNRCRRTHLRNGPKAPWLTPYKTGARVTCKPKKIQSYYSLCDPNDRPYFNNKSWVSLALLEFSLWSAVKLFVMGLVHRAQRFGTPFRQNYIYTDIASYYMGPKKIQTTRQSEWRMEISCLWVSGFQPTQLSKPGYWR